ncbi:unnamed protein product [Calypogeia fissa]
MPTVLHQNLNNQLNWPPALSPIDLKQKCIHKFHRLTNDLEVQALSNNRAGFIENSDLHRSPFGFNDLIVWNRDLVPTI